MLACAQVVLVYTVLFFVVNGSSTAYAAFVHCTVSFGILYYAVAVSRDKAQSFTTRLALKLRRAIVNLSAEKLFRLTHGKATQANFSDFLGAELQTFMGSISAVPVGLTAALEVCGSAFGLSFLIGKFAYLVLALILGKSSHPVDSSLLLTSIVYFGYLVYATVKLGPAKKAFAEKCNKRLTKTLPVMQNLRSIKTLGLQAYYLADLLRLRAEETSALKKLRQQSRAISDSCKWCLVPLLNTSNMSL